MKKIYVIALAYILLETLGLQAKQDISQDTHYKQLKNAKDNLESTALKFISEDKAQLAAPYSAAFLLASALEALYKKIELLEKNNN